MSWTARGCLAALSTAAVLGTAGVTVAVASESGNDRRIDTSPVTGTSGAVDTESAGDLSLQISGVLDAALNQTNQLTSQFQTAQQRVALAKQRAAQQARAQQVAAAERAEREQAERTEARAAERATSSPIPVASVGKDDDADDVAARPGKHRGDHRDARERARDRRTDDRPGRHRGWDRERGWERHGDDGPGRHRGHDRHDDD
ncbi:hypothetical protein [Aeromicrobium sp. IC_218]|uniref:hypothetical protein n=1 Tax=Aeromicrobium sp. IC_218 TaxID=2545468 RepID=UPI001040A7E6|nr:hypothetical protein [Aeromicrobium sp. IC_218]TCJ00211.1 hypothetical protein E0W78_03190 [Aeromicrobium sp. IC_218]